MYLVFPNTFEVGARVLMINAILPINSGTKRETTGINMWPVPFILKNKNGEEIAVFFMDTQGTFDNVSTERDNVSIFGIAALTSTIFVRSYFTGLLYSELRCYKANTIIPRFAKVATLCFRCTT